MVEPMYSPWGTVDHCKTLYPGVFEVSTARHGGIMVRREVAMNLLSKDALNVGFVEGRYHCFEEDCDAQVVIRELLDQGLMEAIVNAHFKEGEYSDCIDGVLQTCQPEYWQAREKRLDNAQKELPKDKCNGGEAR